MDPQACLRRLVDALVEHDYDEAKWAASDLKNWLQKGGFCPNVDTLDMIELLRAVERGAEAIDAL